jgi:hypothetical protein
VREQCAVHGFARGPARVIIAEQLGSPECFAQVCHRKLTAWEHRACPYPRQAVGLKLDLHRSTVPPSRVGLVGQIDTVGDSDQALNVVRDLMPDDVRLRSGAHTSDAQQLSKETGVEIHPAGRTVERTGTFLVASAWRLGHAPEDHQSRRLVSQVRRREFSAPNTLSVVEKRFQVGALDPRRGRRSRQGHGCRRLHRREAVEFPALDRVFRCCPTHGRGTSGGARRRAGAPRRSAPGGEHGESQR